MSQAVKQLSKVESHAQVMGQVFLVGIGDPQEINTAQEIFLSMNPANDVELENATQEEKILAGYNRYIDSGATGEDLITAVRAKLGKPDGQPGGNQINKQQIPGGEEKNELADTTTTTPSTTRTAVEMPTFSADNLRILNEASKDMIHQSLKFANESKITKVIIANKPYDTSDVKMSVNASVEDIEKHAAKVIDTPENQERYQKFLEAARDKSIKYPGRKSASKGTELGVVITHPSTEDEAKMVDKMVPKAKMFQTLMSQFASVIPTTATTAGARVKGLEEQVSNSKSKGAAVTSKIVPVIEYKNKAALYASDSTIIEANSKKEGETTEKSVNLDLWFEIVTDTKNKKGEYTKRKIFARGTYPNYPVYERTNQAILDAFGPLASSQEILPLSADNLEDQVNIYSLVFAKSDDPSFSKSLPTEVLNKFKEVQDKLKTDSNVEVGNDF